MPAAPNSEAVSSVAFDYSGIYLGVAHGTALSSIVVKEWPDLSLVSIVDSYSWILRLVVYLNPNCFVRAIAEPRVCAFQGHHVACLGA